MTFEKIETGWFTTYRKFGYTDKHGHKHNKYYRNFKRISGKHYYNAKRKFDREMADLDW